MQSYVGLEHSQLHCKGKKATHLIKAIQGHEQMEITLLKNKDFFQGCKRLIKLSCCEDGAALPPILLQVKKCSFSYYFYHLLTEILSEFTFLLSSPFSQCSVDRSLSSLIAGMRNTALSNFDA